MKILLIIFVRMLFFVDHGTALAGEALDDRLLLDRDFDLDGAGEGIYLDDRAAALGGVDHAVHGGSFGDLLLIGGVFVVEAAHKAATNARNFVGIKGQVLLLGHFDGDLNEIRQVAGAAEGSAAGTETAHELGLVAYTDLAELYSGMEDRGQILDQIAEVNAACRGEVEDQLCVIEGELGVHQLHIEAVGCDLFDADAEGIGLFDRVFLVVSHVLGRGEADDGAQGLHHALVEHAGVGKADLTELHSSCGLDDDAVTDSGHDAAGREIIHLAHLLEADADHLGTGAVVLCDGRTLGEDGVKLLLGEGIGLFGLLFLK